MTIYPLGLAGFIIVSGIETKNPSLWLWQAAPPIADHYSRTVRQSCWDMHSSGGTTLHKLKVTNQGEMMSEIPAKPLTHLAPMFEGGGALAKFGFLALQRLVYCTQEVVLHRHGNIFLKLLWKKKKKKTYFSLHTPTTESQSWGELPKTIDANQ